MHVVQATPPSPQAKSLFPGSHVAPLQQPAGHEVASQTQAPPLVPQSASDGVMHVAPSQQPAGHDAASQTQTPPTQRAPAPQAGPRPH